MELFFDILGEIFSGIYKRVRMSPAMNSETKRRIGIIAAAGFFLCFIGYLVCELLG